MLHYFPLETYVERYTAQLSGEDGWLCRRWKANGIPYVRVLPTTQRRTSIKVGQVLDAVGRSIYAMQQVAVFLDDLENGRVADGDVVYFDDFWHPGIECIPYVAQQMGITLRMYAMLHAQSIDEYDFTYPMRGWMRSFEQGIGRVLSGIFVTNTQLAHLVIESGIAPFEKVCVAGLPYNSEEVIERLPSPMPIRKKKQVIFCSRFDSEKQPHFFLDVVERVKAIDSSIDFVVTTSSSTLKSNDPSAVSRAMRCKDVQIKTGLSKAEYYAELAQSKVQLNTALQDWVSWTLLEATTAGCYPLYPWFRSFPETLQYDAKFMYMPDRDACARRIVEVMNANLGSPSSWSWIYKRFDESWRRMAVFMGLLDQKVDPLYV